MFGEDIGGLWQEIEQTVFHNSSDFSILFHTSDAVSPILKSFHTLAL